MKNKEVKIYYNNINLRNWWRRVIKIKLIKKIKLRIRFIKIKIRIKREKLKKFKIKIICLNKWRIKK